MAFIIMGVPIVTIIAIILIAVVYYKTKSLAKVGYSLEIIIAIVVVIFSTRIADNNITTAINLLALGLIINGLVSLFKK